MIDLRLFINERLGHQVCDSGQCQCVALMNTWLKANRWPLPKCGDPACGAGYLQFPAPWQQVILIRSAQPGDVVIWSPNLPGAEGHGHVGIFVQHYSTGFQSFDQNWSTSCCSGPTPCCCLINHTDPNSDLAYVQAIWRYPQPQPPKEGTVGNTITRPDGFNMVLRRLSDGHVLIGYSKDGASYGAFVDLGGETAYAPWGAYDPSGVIRVYCVALAGDVQVNSYNPQADAWSGWQGAGAHV